MSDQLALFDALVSPGRPRKPALRFYGGKWSLADWVISYFPHGFERMHYVEPFGGAAGVLLSKPPSILETYNDLDSRLVTFFRVLREREEELARSLERTPFSREEYMRSFEPAPDELETARRVFVAQWQSIGGTNGRKSGWRGQRTIESRYTPPARDYNQAIENLSGVSRRFREVQIENLPALELIRKTDSPETLFYVDPPLSQRIAGIEREIVCPRNDHAGSYSTRGDARRSSWVRGSELLSDWALWEPVLGLGSGRPRRENHERRFGRRIALFESPSRGRIGVKFIKFHPVGIYGSQTETN